jgi:site-specific DNA-methyltransferase (adenine-specific)
MKAMPDNFIDSIVTDPPYELGFMGKSWDSTGIAFNVAVWTEALRVLKPGGHLIAFSGSRTYHRMAVAIEDAGFEIRDQIMWVYGSGFPKSHNISKGIDKAENIEVWENNAYGGGNSKCDKCGKWLISGNPCQCPKPIVEFKTEVAQQWQGWGTALKPAHEPMVLARKPVVGTVANNVLTYGVGGLNIDGTRVGYQEGEVDFSKQQNQTTVATVKMGGAKPGDLIQMFKENGRWPANFIHDGSDEVVALFPNSKAPKPYGGEDYKDTSMFGIGGVNHGNEYGDSGSAARFFYCAKASKRDRNEGLEEFEEVREHDGRAQGKVGGNNPRNRTNAAKLNHHPTVKPTSLMQYLVRLVTPQGGTVLDPFMGSGSTGKACVYEGFNFIGIDQSSEYVGIARARIEFAVNNKAEMLDVDI